MKPNILLAALAFSVLSFAQGPLAPPGAPAPTMKTLDEIHTKVADVGERRTPISALPFTISAGGSYFLTGNLASGGGNGITITASNVTLDLNGFTLNGLGSAQPAIRLTTVADVRVFGGSIGSWAQGVLLTTSGRCFIEKVNISSCTGVGILQSGGGDDCQVRDCTVSACGSHGIHLNGYAVVTGNVVRDSGASGIRLDGQYGEVRGNTVQRNNVGVELISSGSFVESNAISLNTTGLRVVTTNCSIRRNSFRGNGASTIFAGNDVAPFEPAATSTNPHANISY